MWKAILFRRPLRPQRDDAPKHRPEPTREQPFADLMAKLDRIPYRRTWRRATEH